MFLTSDLHGPSRVTLMPVEVLSKRAAEPLGVDPGLLGHLDCVGLVARRQDEYCTHHANAAYEVLFG